MKKKIIIAATTIAMMTLVAIPAFAESDSNSKGNNDSGDCTASSTSTKCIEKANKAASSTAEKNLKKLTKAQEKADKETDDRIEKLNKLISRIQDFKNIQDSQRSSIIATIQALIAHMTTLKNEIDASASTTTVSNDRKTIAQDYRITALAIPQLNIVAASDRIMTIVTMMGVIGTKIQARLALEPNLASSSVQTMLADLAAKIADAKTQSQNAFNEVSPLLPDGGDKAKMAANTATLKDGRAKIKLAQKDLDAASKDAKSIIKLLVKGDKDMMKIDKDSFKNTHTGTTTGSTTP